jgi:hypothetical protein
VGAPVDSIGKTMTDDRPMPQYGEYATPEQQAAAMGKQYVAPTPPPEPGTRVDLAAPVAAQERLRIPGNAVDRFATIFQLGIGLVLLLNSDFFHIAETLNTVAQEFGSSHRVATSLDAFGWVFLGANIVFLLATMVASYLRLRRAKLAFWVPFVGYFAFSLVIAIAVYA